MQGNLLWREMILQDVAQLFPEIYAAGIIVLCHLIKDQLSKRCGLNAIAVRYIAGGYFKKRLYIYIHKFHFLNEVRKTDFVCFAVTLGC